MLRVWRLFLVRPRLVLSIALMMTSFLFIPASLSSPTRIFTAWNIGVWFYIVSLWVLMFRADSTRIKKIAQKQNDSAALMLGLICVAAVMSLLAVVIELPAIKQLTSDLRQVHIALTALTLVGTCC